METAGVQWTDDEVERHLRSSYEGWKRVQKAHIGEGYPDLRSSYEGWKHPREGPKAGALDLICDLPMRDGNECVSDSSMAGGPDLRSSYEGWKLERNAVVHPLHLQFAIFL